MARTALTTQQALPTGIVPSFTAANADGHILDGDGDVLLYVKNGGASPINVTIQTPGTVGGLAVTEQIVAVANAAEKIIGRFPPAVYTRDPGLADPGKVYVDFSAVTSVTVAAIGV